MVLNRDFEVRIRDLEVRIRDLETANHITWFEVVTSKFEIATLK